MGLSLVVGPAHAGKVGRLLEGFLASADRDPWLIVPNRADVERVERELVARCGGLLSGTIGTFDTLFEALAHGDGQGRPSLGDAARAALVKRACDAAGVDGARFPGYADAAARSLAELDGALLAPEDLPSPLGAIASRYRAELDRLGVWDRGLLRRRAVERLTGELGSWDGNPVFAHGFEDLTGAEWRLLEALSARAEVHVSIPYEPGRAVYASLQRTVADLASLAGETIVELPPRASDFLPPDLAHLERALFTDAPRRAPLDGSIRWLEGAGTRGTFELVAEEVLALVRSGTPPDGIGVVCPSVESVRLPLATAFAALGVPVSFEGRAPLRSTPFGHALLSLLRFAWLGGERPELFAHLRSPYSGLQRKDVDWVEGRLRGRGILAGERAVEVTVQLRDGRSLPPIDALQAADGGPVEGVRRLAATMLRNAHGTSAPPLGPRVLSDLRSHDAVTRTLDELEALAAGGYELTSGDLLAGLERATVRGDGTGAPGKVAVLDLLRARTRRFDAMFVLGLEQGSLPRRPRIEPFVDDEARRALDERGARLVRPDAASRDRYLFATACSRPRRRLVLVRQAVGDEGSPREPSPFWEAVRELFDEDDVRRATHRRPLSALVPELEAAPTERERLRALAALAAREPREAAALARENGWDRRLTRATAAFARPTRVTHERALRLLGRESYSVSELERMASCSSAWFVERYLRPATIDKQIDRMLRGSILHAALQRFYQQLPSAVPGADRVTEENVEQAVALMRDCVADAVETGLRIDAGDLDRRELEQGLQRDLEQLVRDEATSKSPFVPRHLEVSFRSFELEPGVVVSGKIDRVDGDPMGARGIVVDYKSGAASSASQIRDRDLLQLPLYMLVLRQNLGLEPMGGVYVPVGGGRRPRGLLRAGDDAVPGFSSRDYLDEAAFDEAIDGARETAVGLVERIRSGDVRHDPQGGDCPPWCDLWRMCRKERA